MRRVLALVLLVVAAASLPFALALGRAEAGPAPTSLASVSWLSGHWVGQTATGRHIEEMWMPERDGHMLGSFRWERGRGRWLFEFMTLTAEPPVASGTGPVLTLRLKHFDRQLQGLEEKHAATTFALVEATSDRVIFEMKDGAAIKRVGYARSGADTLTATFDELEPGKPATHLEFPYTRVK